MLINYEKHCSLNLKIRKLYYEKRSINYSKKYTERQKVKLITSIENEIIRTWNEIKSC